MIVDSFVLQSDARWFESSNLVQESDIVAYATNSFEGYLIGCN